MAVNTVNQFRVSTNGKLFYEACKAVARQRNPPFSKPEGASYFFDFTSATIVAATSLADADSEVFFTTFPLGAKLESLRVDPTDMDTHGTPTLEADVIVETSGGTETILINSNGSTVWETGGVDELDADISQSARNVSGQKLGIKVRSAAATGANGTVRVSGVIWLGDAINH